jgi:gamma-glutamyltranspeptidase/glutathione hydrolase
MLALSAVLAGCSAFDSAINSDLTNVPGGDIKDFRGGVVADEPQAAVIGRAVLQAGGNAADAAAAMGFGLAVTLPSRAGLGAGGGCLVYSPAVTGPGGGTPEALMFSPVAPANPGRADRPAAVPMLARGLFALQARYGTQAIEPTVARAEQLARFGVPASRAFVRDLAVVAGPLAADPIARELFYIGASPLGEGDSLLQPELAATLAQLRTAGIGDLYQGVLARRIEEGMATAHGGLTVADLRPALPAIVAPLIVPGIGGDMVASFPAPESGGVATAGAWQVLAQAPGNTDAARARALGLAATFRKGGVDPAALLAGETPSGTLSALPASATFGAVDSVGQAVICAVSMGNLFGTGRMVPGTGILLGASPARLPQPLLSVALAWNPTIHAFHGAAGGSGQLGAPVAAALGLRAGIAGQFGATSPEPGRANVLACPRYLPGSNGSCGWFADPRAAGLAIGSN